MSRFFYSIVFILFFVQDLAFCQDIELFNPLFFGATVKIENLSRGTGTGIMIRKMVRDDVAEYFLVTNKHVIGNWAPDKHFVPDSAINILFYVNDSIHPTLPFPIPIFDHHSLRTNIKLDPNPLIDVVVIKLDLGWRVKQNYWATEFIPFECLLPMNKITSVAKLEVGGLALTIGYPALKASYTNGQGLVKRVSISSPLTNLNQYPWNTESQNEVRSDPSAFIIDADLRKGNSGGAVIVPYENCGVNGDVHVLVNGIKWNYVIGIVSSGNEVENTNFVFSCDAIINLIQNW